MLAAYLSGAGYAPAQIGRALDRLRREADNHGRRLYGNNKAKFDPVDLHLLAGSRLEAHHRIDHRRRAQAPQKCSQLAEAADVTLRRYLAVENRRRNPLRPRCRLPFPQVVLKGWQLRRPLLLPLVFRRTTAHQVAAHRIDRTSNFRRDPPQTESVLLQNISISTYTSFVITGASNPPIFPQLGVSIFNRWPVSTSWRMK